MLAINRVASFTSYDSFFVYSTDLYNDPDFTSLDWYDTLEELQGELMYQGLSREVIAQINRNIYGDILEVLEYNGEYLAFIGAR